MNTKVMQVNLSFNNKYTDNNYPV